MRRGISTSTSASKPRAWRRGLSAFTARQAFHRDFAARAVEKRWLRLWLRDVDSEFVATWYGLGYRDVECSHQSGRDPAWQHSSIGPVLLAGSRR